MLRRAKVADYFQHRAEFGIAAESWKINMAGVRDRKRKMVNGLVAMHQQKYKQTGAELVMGDGRFVAPKTIEVALNTGRTRTLHGQIAIISTGSRARIDDTPGLSDTRRIERARSPRARHLLSLSEAPNGRRAASTNALRDPRISEGARRRA
jgi:pyruvate/2-oxoglutarate dehydrogenase complex dihydrolipoamide dehydrogenase (E3) component